MKRRRWGSFAKKLHLKILQERMGGVGVAKTEDHVTSAIVKRTEELSYRDG